MLTPLTLLDLLEDVRIAKVEEHLEVARAAIMQLSEGCDWERPREGGHKFQQPESEQAYREGWYGPYGNIGMRSGASQGCRHCRAFYLGSPGLIQGLRQCELFPIP